MILQLKTPIGAMAVLKDEKTKQAEVIDVDRIMLLSLVINVYNGIAQFAMGLGGLDAAGRFHLDPKHADQVVHVVMDRRREATPGAFDGVFCDAIGNPSAGYTPEFFDTLAKDVLVKMGYQLCWGASFPDMEVYLGEECIFKPAAPPPPPEPAPALNVPTETTPFPPPATPD